MEITTERVGAGVELRVVGRLDAYWADHLTRALEQAVRDGNDCIRINMAEVVYMSSVGIRVLLKFYKQLQRIKGSLSVSEPSEAVRTVLELAGLQVLLEAAGGAAMAEASAVRPESRRMETANGVFDVFGAAPNGSLACHVIGQPDLLQSCSFTAERCRKVTFGADALGVGLGAFGGDFADCQGRFGEFLAAGGAAAYLPTDGTNVPDSLIGAGAFVPQLSVLYAITCDGSLAHLARFEARDTQGSVPLSEVATTALALTTISAAGIVLVAESAGLVGATLQRSPVAKRAEADPFAYPEIRDWLSFTPERTHSRAVALVVGVVARADDPTLSPLLRPLGSAPWPVGHFHAAAFSYRPLQRGYVEMQPVVSALFEGEALQGVLHLLNDDRRISGAGESAFVRGACWVSPISSIVADR